MYNKLGNRMITHFLNWITTNLGDSLICPDGQCPSLRSSKLTDILVPASLLYSSQPRPAVANYSDIPLRSNKIIYIQLKLKTLSPIMTDLQIKVLWSDWGAGSAALIGTPHHILQVLHVFDCVHLLLHAGSTRTTFKRSTGYFWFGEPVTFLEASFRKCKRVIFTCSACATSTRSTPFYTLNTLYTFYHGFYCILILINMVFVAIVIFAPLFPKENFTVVSFRKGL